jgi:hypothetical protein
MREPCDAITWQSWSQKWGQWTDWFRRASAVRNTEQSKLPPSLVKPLNSVQKESSTRMINH